MIHQAVGVTAGRLNLFYKNWELITKDKIILSWIKGYEIPFKSIPTQNYVPVSTWTKIESLQIEKQIHLLLEKGAISKCEHEPDQFISKIFLVPKPDGSSRLILNLKNLNKFLEPQHFKLEDTKTVIRLISKNCFMVTLDLTDAYHLIGVNKKDRKYLRFMFKNNLYEYNCIPFGLCEAPRVFTKITKPILYILRKMGFLSVVYLDDFILFGNSYEECMSNLKNTRFILECLGFLVNLKKSSLTPSQKCKYLGLEFDSKNLRVSLPNDKRKNILEQIEKIQKIDKCTIRYFAEFIGKLVAASIACKYSVIHIKSFEREKFLALKINNDNYDGLMRIDSKLNIDLNWWRKNILTTYNPIRSVNFKMEIFSDASLSGWGVHCKYGKSHGYWNVNERKLHINVLELKAALFGLHCFAKELHNCDILLRIDNTTAISYINKMGGIQFPVLNDIAREIWEWCEERGIWIYASYIRSKDNIIADAESRKLEPETEYELAHYAFKSIIEKFGQPEIDLFATRINAKCDKYVSWFRDPFSMAIDAFTINWSLYYFYAFPPFAIILKVLRKIKDDKATGIIVVPFWATQPWFPVFNSMLIDNPIFFKPNKNLLISSTRDSHPLQDQLTLVVGKLSGRHTE